MTISRFARNTRTHAYTTHTTHTEVVTVKESRGLALADILTEVHKYVMRLELPPAMRLLLLDRLADVEYVLCAVCVCVWAVCVLRVCCPALPL